MTQFVRLFVVLGLAFAHVCVQASEEDLWEKLRAGGLVVLMRHAQTEPGVGDPPSFRLGECSTQRNLSAAGREQARRIGAALKRRRVPVGEVYSSAWCRARETAQLAFGRADAWNELNSVHHDRSETDARTQAIRRRVAAFRGPGNLFLVGHGANILALTGQHPAMGGLVVLAPGGPEGFRVVGQLDPDKLMDAPHEQR